MEFDLLFCRIWQFLIGTFAFILNKQDESVLEPSKSPEKKYKNLYYGAILSLITLCTMPEISISVDYKFAVRLLATLLTGVIIDVGHHTKLLLPVTLDVFLTYLGDISYSFYLVHWPIILFGRYAGYDSTVFGFISITVLCIIASVLLYEFLDKLIPTKTTFTVFTQTGVVFGIILMLCSNTLLLKLNLTEQKIEQSKDLSPNLSIQEIIRINENFERTCYQSPIHRCHNESTISRIYPMIKFGKEWGNTCVVDIQKNGTKTVALLGNSFASRFAVTAAKGLREFSSVKKLYLITRAACTIFDTLNAVGEPQWRCEELLGKTRTFLRTVRPNILIHVSA